MAASEAEELRSRTEEFLNKSSICDKGASHALGSPRASVAAFDRD
jgi:hypothetical protein